MSTRPHNEQGPALSPGQHSLAPKLIEERPHAQAAPGQQPSATIVRLDRTENLPLPGVAADHAGNGSTPSYVPDTSLERTDNETATPSSEALAEIMVIWRDVLTVDHLELDSNFFELGGHSLLALRVIARVLERFQPLLPADTFEFEGQLLNALFEQPTVRTMALMVDEALVTAIERMSDEEVQHVANSTARSPA